MNALGKFLESKLRSQIIILIGFACCIWAYWEPLLLTNVLDTEIPRSKEKVAFRTSDRNPVAIRITYVWSAHYQPTNVGVYMVQIARGALDGSGLFAACVFDVNGYLVASNAAHALFLGRDIGSLTGRNWREWTARQEMKSSEENFQRCLAGEPAAMVRHVIRPDGSVVMARSQIFRTEGSKPLVIGTMQVKAVNSEILTQDSFESAALIQDMTTQMANVAETVGLIGLRSKLLEVAAEAGNIVARLKPIAVSNR